MKNANTNTKSDKKKKDVLKMNDSQGTRELSTCVTSFTSAKHKLGLNISFLGDGDFC